MTTSELLSAADVELMQGLAQRITATRPELVNSDASFGELAWNWGRTHTAQGSAWRRRLWFSDGEPVAWGWAQMPRSVQLSDGTVANATGACLAYQVHPDHADLVDEVIDWYDATAVGLERTVLPGTSDGFALERWAAHGYVPDPSGQGEIGSWTQLNQRDLTDVEPPKLPDGYRFHTADEAEEPRSWARPSTRRRCWASIPGGWPASFSTGAVRAWGRCSSEPRPGSATLVRRG